MLQLTEISYYSFS